MRFLVMVKATPQSEAGVLPDSATIAKVAAFNKELVDADMYLDSGGLRPSSEGVRMHSSGERQHVDQGPFTPPQELVSGFWLLQAKSKKQLLDMFAGCPFLNDEVIEIREIRP